MKSIAVLMTCHNRKDKTLRCLQSLYANELPSNYYFDIFLVDDGSDDGTSDAVILNYSQVNIIAGNGNLYWNRGMHKAWGVASDHREYDYYLWLNDDTYLFKNALNAILYSANETLNKSIVVAATCSEVTGLLTYSGYLMNGDQVNPSSNLESIVGLNGNCVLISKEIYKLVGNLDPLFHHAIGDLDYGYRALKKGVNAYLAPEFLAYCEGNKVLPKWCDSSVPFLLRLKNLYSPLACSQPYPYFRYKLRHFGFLIAVRHLVSIYLRLFFPRLWKHE